MGLVSKTAAFIGLDSLRNLVSDSIAIDMGSASTIIYVRGQGVVVDEPSLVAVDNLSGKVVSVGVEARQMYGRETRDLTVVAPLLNGVVADFERTREMLASFVRQARGSISIFSRRALMSVDPGVTQVERRALVNAAEHARIGRVLMIDEGLATAFGAGIKPNDAHASAVVIIGGGTTNIVIVASGAIIHSRSERIGSGDIDAAIVNHVRRNRGLAIGPLSAEQLKLDLASAVVPDELGREVSVRGRDVVTGSPDAIELTAGEIYPIAQTVVGKIVDVVDMTLAELPPEVAGDIYDRGIVMAGGGALFSGIADYVRDRTKLPVQVTDEPRYATVRGLARMFDDPLLLRRVVRSEAPPLLDNQSEAYSL